jgi:putative DNA primase/helicase
VVLLNGNVKSCSGVKCVPERRMTTNKMPDAALEYATTGRPVLPLVPGAKNPLTDKGFYDATTDEATIRQWWAAAPAANVGIRVGVDTSVFVIDVDNKGGKDGVARLIEHEARLGALPNTYSTATKHGKHYYFEFPEAWRDEFIKAEYAPGLDIKTKGYVVAPPSVVDGFEYYVIERQPFSMLPKPWVQDAIKPEIPTDWKKLACERGSGQSICEEYNIRLSDVLPIPRDAKKTSEGYLIKHPIHGATGSGNLSLNMSRDLWHCFRHNTGGDPLTWIAVREGFIDCANAGPLHRDIVNRCLQVLRNEGKVPEEVAICKTVTTTVGGTKKTEVLRLRRLDALANIERFLSYFGDCLRWCLETRRWFMYNGTCWAEVSNEYVRACARKVVWIIREEATLIDSLTKLSHKEKEAMVKRYNGWAQSTAYKNSLDAIVESVKADLEISVHRFDTDPLLYNVAQGTFDIRTGKVRPFSREDYITHFGDVPYEPGARDETWDAFLERVQPNAEVRDFLQRAEGYSLTGLTTEEALFFGYGAGATGKSTFMAALLGNASSYGDVSKFATFLADRTASGGSPREDVTRLIGLRTVACNEVNKNTKFNGALVKTLVSGERYVARVPYSQHSISFDPIFKLWLFANDRPRIEYDDDAVFRRVYVLPFNVVIPPEEQDKNLRNYFKTDLSAQKALLAWALDGAVAWYKRSEGGKCDGLKAPAVVRAATLAYQLAMSPVYEFIADACAVGCYADGTPFEEYTSSLWDAYDSPQAHYDTRRVRSAKALGKHLTAFWFKPYKDRVGARKWRYIRLLEPDEVLERPAGLAPNVATTAFSPFCTHFPQNSKHKEDMSKVCDFCLHFYANAVTSTNPTEHSEHKDQTEIAQLVRETLEKLRFARRSSKTGPIERSNLISAVVMHIHQHDNGTDEQVAEKTQQFVERICSDDKEIAALMADLTR